MKPIMSEEISSEENSGASKDILPIFWDLASLDEAKRIDKVVDLVSTLKSQDSTDEDVCSIECLGITWASFVAFIMNCYRRPLAMHFRWNIKGRFENIHSGNLF